jgi:hypothetical protein
MSGKNSKARASTGSQPRDLELIVEKDVRIPMRDGAILYADVFRPDGGEERFPAIMNISVYQKDKLWVPPADLEEGPNPYMNWETANPLWWCPRGYAPGGMPRMGKSPPLEPSHTRLWIFTTQLNGRQTVGVREDRQAFPTTPSS